MKLNSQLSTFIPSLSCSRQGNNGAMHCSALSVAVSLRHSSLRSCSVLSTARRLHRSLTLRHCQPPRSAQFASSAFVENNGVFDVSVGGNGCVTLHVVQPKLQVASHVGPANVIIRLPAGPLFHSFSSEDPCSTPSYSYKSGGTSTDSASIEDAYSLADATASTIVTINYRLGLLPCAQSNRTLGAKSKLDNDRPTAIDVRTDTSESHGILYRYPTPVHDTLAGFDWVLQNLKPKRLGVIGTHIGGSLALMLALTEPQYVHAVAAVEPVCDWTSLDEHCAPSTVSTNLSSRRKTQRMSRNHTPQDLVSLLQARESFFATPERYFDAFASPIRFLRSAGKDVPKDFPAYLTGAEYPVPVLVSKESEESPELFDAHPRQDNDIPVDLEALSDPDSSEGNPHPVRRRKALSRWPPHGLDYGVSGPSWSSSRHTHVKRLNVTLPWVRIFTREDTSSSTEPDTSPRRTSSRREKGTHMVLTHQAHEMVDVMRRACFFGREKGFGENRVTLRPVSSSGGVSTFPRSGELDCGEWLGEILNLDT